MNNSDKLLITLKSLLSDLSLQEGEDTHANITIENPENFKMAMRFCFEELFDYLNVNVSPRSEIILAKINWLRDFYENAPESFTNENIERCYETNSAIAMFFNCINLSQLPQWKHGGQLHFAYACFYLQTAFICNLMMTSHLSRPCLDAALGALHEFSIYTWTKNDNDGFEVISEHLKTLAAQLQKKSNLIKEYMRKNVIWPKEAKLHIERLNSKSIDTKGTLFGQVISAGNALLNDDANMSILEQLSQAALKIKEGTQPRTQFITCMNANLHAFMYDISWNPENSCFDILCIDSINNDFVYDLSANLSDFLSESGNASRFVLCKTDLQKDDESCGLYAIKFAKIASGLQFEDLWQKGETPADESLKDFSLKTVPVTALGLKAVTMGQSLLQMRKQLATFGFEAQPNILTRFNSAVKVPSLRNKTTVYHREKAKISPL